MNEEEYNELTDVELHFEYLHKGCYTYIGEIDGTPVILHGGAATYEDAYDLELGKIHKFSELCYNPSLWDIERKDGKIIVSPNATYYF